jgi:hypothetical protein
LPACKDTRVCSFQVTDEFYSYPAANAPHRARDVGVQTALACMRDMEVHDDAAAQLAASLSGLGLKRKASAPTPKSCPACEELQGKRSRGGNLSLADSGICQRIAAVPTCAHCTYRAACRHKDGQCCESLDVVKLGASEDVEMTGSKRRARARASTEHRTAGTALRRSPRWSTAATDDDVNMAAPQDPRAARERPLVDAYDGGDEGEEEGEGTTLRARTRLDHPPKPVMRWEYRSRYSE